jgi:Resolvase, N terminal domain
MADLCIAYYRVSTQRTGPSLEVQQRAVRDHLDGGGWTLLAELIEIESAKRADRPKLEEALTLCRVHGAKLIIAKLDRLARNVAFVSNLMKSDVEFEAVDFPQANRTRPRQSRTAPRPRSRRPRLAASSWAASAAEPGRPRSTCD